MGDKFISSTLVEKLGHKIPEIRERALHNIVSKLNNGVVFDNDLASSKELISKLFKWFLHEPPSQEEVVFVLLKRIFQSKSGAILIYHLGKPCLIKELEQIRSYLEHRHVKYVNELESIIRETDTTVPPLESDIPLSYRSNGTTNTVNNNGVNYTLRSSRSVGTTATTIVGYVRKSSSEEQQGYQTDTESHTNAFDEIRYRLESNDDVHYHINNLPNYYFTWQPLIGPDKHVLDSVARSLSNPPQPSALIHSCEFFVNVLLHDFPAEIFLQRPTIIKEFLGLMNCGSNRITNLVLTCLLELTKALCARIKHCTDVSVRNIRLEHMYEIGQYSNTPASSTNRSSENNGSERFESNEEMLAMKKIQISTPGYCFMAAKSIFQFLMSKNDSFGGKKSRISQNALNLCLLVLEELLMLICLTVKKGIWDQKQTDFSLDVWKQLNETFVHYGDTLDHFRLASITSEKNVKYRAVYIFLIHNCAKLLQKLVPISKTRLILPRNLKIALANSLLDVTLGRVYSEMYLLILNYVESFSIEDGSSDPLQKYKDVKIVCDGMSSTMEFLREHQNLSVARNLELAKLAIPSLEFHKSIDFLRTLIDVLSSSLENFSDSSISDVADVILPLLSHSSNDIREDTYRLCHRKVVDHLGPKSSSTSSSLLPGSQVCFLLSSKIPLEIAAFGMTDTNLEIQKYAEDILLYILKCKIIVDASIIWNRVIEALIPSLPILICHATRNNMLGKTVLSLTDPDNARVCHIPEISMLKCNCQFLFSEDAYLRDEAFSRICWLLSSQPNARELLPKVNTLYDTALANVCRLKRTVDVNRIRRTEHFYQASSLLQVMDVFNSSNNVEPVIKRSALNQLSVMMEDPLLHQIFLDTDGLSTITKIMQSALIETDYRDYPDSIIPIVSILKNLCFYHGSVREELAMDMEVFFWILRGLFMFFNEERLRQDASTLLFLLVLKDFISGNPSKGDVSLPLIVIEKMVVPFQCGTHWKHSPYIQPSLIEVISSDRWCQRSIQIQWNAEIFGGFEQLIKLKEINYDVQFRNGFVDQLKLTKGDLESIKVSSIDFCIKNYLNIIENGTSHVVLLEAIDHLSLYVSLYKITRYFQKKENDDFLSHSWEKSFVRFIGALPSSEEDLVLLRKVVRFFSLLVPFYTPSGKDCWISRILKDPSQFILDLITVSAEAEEHTKLLGQELLTLICYCIREEQHYLDFYNPNEVVKNDPKLWCHIIKIIINNLKFREDQHFYNLAYLNSLISTLVHLTATLGWSDQKPNTMLKEPLSGLIINLCELVSAFHSGKGATAAISVMGLSITRNVLLVLNNLLAELRHTKVKNWEGSFMDDVETGSILKGFLSLWASRDVVLRAAAMQLFSGLSVSPRAALKIVDDVKVGDTGIWELAFNVLNDHNEASIVRENAAQFLANMAAHLSPISGENSSSINLTLFRKSSTMDFFNLMKEYNFYANLDIVFHNLYTLNVNGMTKYPDGIKFVLNSVSSENSCGSSTSSENIENGDHLVTTPALIKSLANLLLNTLNLNAEEVSAKMQEHCLVKLLFRTLCDATMSIKNTKELSLYCDLLEMNTSVCLTLNRLASSSSICLGTILHTKDCFNVLLSLLNSKIYHIQLPQLVYLRNRLWSEIFNLLSSLIEHSGSIKDRMSKRSLDAVSVFSGTLLELGNEAFFETLCESVSCMGSKDLQNSALNSLTCLLRVETFRAYEETKGTSSEFLSVKSSLQTFLDSVRTSRSVVISDAKENFESEKSLTKILPKYSPENVQMNFLEEVYFGNVFRSRSRRKVTEDIELSFLDNNETNGLVCGAELCKILCYLYDVCDIKLYKDKHSLNRKKTMVMSALSGLLCVSKEAKKHALQNGFLLVVIKQLREHHVRLSLDSVDCLRRVSDKKRLCPILKQVNDLICLLNNFMLNAKEVKHEAATINLADVIHKLWVWLLVQSEYTVEVLRMLSTYTKNCSLACQSLPLTSSVAGAGPRKSPSNVSILHAVITLINKRMEFISKTHDSSILEEAFNVLHNACEALECRILISKSNIFQSISRIHPAITKLQKSWEDIESLWLNFLQTFTMYPEGQTCVAKIPNLLDLIISLTNNASSRTHNRISAMTVLRNLTFYQPNKSRLLSSVDFLNTLSSKLSGGGSTYMEKNIVVVIIWALAANNQRAKMVLKSAHLDNKLQDVARQLQLSSDDEAYEVTREDLDRIYYVLSILTEDRTR